MLAQQKERHLLKLKMFENPALAAQTAAAAAAPLKAAAAPKEVKPKKAVDTAAEAAARLQESGGSGMFDDVDDEYEVDTSALQQKQAQRASAQVRLLSSCAFAVVCSCAFA